MKIVQPLWEILVPHKMGKHDGSKPDLHKSNRTIQVPYHQIWDEYVRKKTGGLTIYRASTGHWIDSNTNKLYKEIMIPVRIACSEEIIEEIAKFTLYHYQQIAVMVTLISEKSIIFDNNTSFKEYFERVVIEAY